MSSFYSSVRATQKLISNGGELSKRAPARHASGVFSTLPLKQTLLDVLSELKLEKMTPVQAESIPLLLAGRDLVGQSQTGTGKTAAFALPILQRLDLKQRRVQALVLSPTRELCTQVARELRKLGRREPGLHVVILSGGQPIFRQVAAMEKGAHIAVGTPGRLLDHLRRGTLDLAQVQTVVLDEADRMLDMGFEQDVTQVLDATPSRRQTVFFSATYPESIANMTRAYQNNPAHVKMTEEEAPDIRQYVYAGAAESRVDALFEVLTEFAPPQTLVFCNLKVTVNDIAAELTAKGVAAAALHGDLEQYERDNVMARFRNHSLRVLVATDVAARGLDIKDLDLVVNLDPPDQPETYVHRVGRTGRAGKKGIAITLIGPGHQRRLQAIEESLGILLDPWMPKGEHPVEAVAQHAPMTTLYIAGGRKDKVRPGDILGALTGEAGGLDAKDVGKIEIHDRLSYVAVSAELAARAVKSLSNGKIKGRKFKVGFA